MKKTNSEKFSFSVLTGMVMLFVVMIITKILGLQVDMASVAMFLMVMYGFLYIIKSVEDLKK